MTFDTYHEAKQDADRRASGQPLDIAIRRCVEYGHVVYVVRYASRNDSDYAKAEIVPSTFQKDTQNVNLDA